MTLPEENPYASPTATAEILPREVASPIEGSNKFRWPAVVIALLGAPLGVASRLARPYASINGVHYEALAALLLLTISVVCLIAVNRYRSGWRDQQWFQITNAGMWLSYTVAWCAVNSGLREDLLGITLVSWVVAGILGGVLLAMWNAWRR